MTQGYNQPINMPRNYTSYWVEQFGQWFSRSAFEMWFGGMEYRDPTHDKNYLFTNYNLLEHEKLYPNEFSPELIRVYVEINVNQGWIEIVDFECIATYYSGMEFYEEGTYLGEINSATKLKEQLISRYWDLSERDDYSQGDEYDEWTDYPQHHFDDKWGRSDDDYAYGAEVIE